MAGGIRSGVIAVLVGAAALVLLGLLTFGVQASVRPHDLPLAIAVPPGSAQLDAVARQIADHGGDAVAWQVTDPARASTLLEDKDIYGYLTLAPGQDGQPVALTGTTSGALLPAAAQAAEGAMRATASAVTTASGGPAPELVITTVHPTSFAGKVLPLAAVSLLWIGGLAGSATLFTMARRSGRRPTPVARLMMVVGNAVIGTLLVFALAHLWDSTTIEWNWAAVWFLVLLGGTFAALQGAALRLLGLVALPILGLLYLMAPSVSSQPPELLNPAYKVLLWSWTPFRIAAEALRSLLYSDVVPDDVIVAWIVFPILGALALAVILWPTRRREPALGRAGGAAGGRHRAETRIVPALALELVARRLEQGTSPPQLTAAAARLAPDGGATDAERARTAARDVIRPAVQRVLTGS